VYVFGRLTGFLENLLEFRNFFCSATAAKKTTLGIIEKKTKKTHWALVKKKKKKNAKKNTLGFGSIIHSSWEAKQRDAAVVGSFITVSLFVCGDGQFTNLSAPFQNDMPLDTHELAKSSSVPSSPNSLSNF